MTNEIKMKIPQTEEMLVGTSDFFAYLDIIKMMLPDYLIILSVKDTPGNKLNGEILKKIHDIGFCGFTKELWRMYIGISNKGNIVCDAVSKEPEERVDYEEQSATINISVSSEAWRRGNSCKIVVDNKDFAVNKRGINLVVYDIDNHRLVDSVCYDAHSSEQGIFSRNRVALLRKHYNVAVTGVWFGANYGSLINGYAIYKLLKDMGLDVLMINKPNAPETDGEIQNPHCKRFIKNFYERSEISPPLPYDELPELNKCCDIFLAGSDQIWHHNIISGFRYTTLLNFVEDSKKKISFGTSFGHRQDFTPDDERVKVKELLRKFSCISVRERASAEILSNIYGIRSTVTIEPVFCLEFSDYEQIAAYSQIKESEPYIFTYILDPTPEIVSAIEYYSNASGMKIINVFDGNPAQYKKSKERFNIPNTIEEAGAEDLINLCLNAAFVITDSFHGTCFSIILNKPFLSITNFRRGAARFQELKDKFGLTGRFSQNSQVIPHDISFMESPDYTEINRMIACDRQAAVAWLKNAIAMPEEQIPSVILPDTISGKLKKELCTGCSACINSCPIGAISLKPDEYGYYRAKVNYDKCIGCGKCLKICPALQLPQNNNLKEPELYEFIAADEVVLYASSSGGAFPLLAREAFLREGVVVGAAWRDDFSVEHIMIDKPDDLYKLQKSKYLQSYTGDIFKTVKEKLEQNIFVLFTGCPCQIAGLNAFLEKDYENLITVDLLCGNAPSTMFFHKYINEAFPEGLRKYEFRHKVEGWNADCTTTTTTTTTGVVSVKRGGKQDNYQRVFHNHTMCPSHCEKCKYQAVPRFGDLTIGDFWWLNNKDKSIDVSKGVSAVLCNNEKGKEFFMGIPEEKLAVRKQVPLEWLGGNGHAINGAHNWCSPNRNDFYKAIRTMTFKESVIYAMKPDHGMIHKRSLFNFSSKESHFSFNPTVWEENFINGIIVLSTKETYPKVGNYAVIPIHCTIQAGESYVLKMRFKISTDSNVYNFHLKSAGEKYFQIIYSHKVSPRDSKEWVDITQNFSADSDIYDEFMIGAAQLNGDNRWIAIDFVAIDKI